MIRLGNSYHKFISHLEEINAAALQQPEQLIRQVERVFRLSLQLITEEIVDQKPVCRVVMLSGPSSSGKTTAAHLLCERLHQHGIGTQVISLDDFYMGEGRAPLLPDGHHDYEAIEALDIPQLQACLLSLLEHGYCDKPNFDFAGRKPFAHKTHIQLKENELAVVEGIHALNPIITENLPQTGLLKLYISVKQGIKDEVGELLSPKDLRLLRRIVRDYKFRGMDPERTLDMWQRVCRGEDLYIRPFKRTSDFTINSLHIYEPCVLGQTALPLLDAVSSSSPSYPYIQSLARALHRFEPIDPDLVPEDSLLREFIGPKSTTV
ncbi:MAG TPA: nucleoside kinase [Candidatus Gallacutalibacter stercoravium]|nr:nucleoside kinase [Candidatus Gallacutalibacter stercoravium]